MARELSTLVTSPRSNPLGNTREPRTGRLALIPLVAAAPISGEGLLIHGRVEANRMEAVAAAVRASGHAGLVTVEPMRGDECWRAREGFAWRSADARGWACAGPGREVRLTRRNLRAEG